MNGHLQLGINAATVLAPYIMTLTSSPIFISQVL